MEQCRAVVKEFCNKNCINKICKYSGISRSCYYFQRNEIEYRPVGRKPPGFTINRDGNYIYDETIVEILKEYRKVAFFMNAGGSKKLSKYIAIEKKIYVNHKKIYRLCGQNNLLLFKQNMQGKRKFKKHRCEYLEVSAPNELWQFDIKYIWIHGEQRWCYFLGFIDVFSKKVTGFYLGKTCKSGDLVFTLNEALKNEQINANQNLVIRSDNGPQMSSNRFYFYLKRLEQKLSHEFIPPRTPNRNAYIEAFNSILETEVLEVKYFRNFKEVYKTISEYIEFYNNRRIHGSIQSLSPNMFINKLKSGELTASSISV